MSSSVGEWVAEVRAFNVFHRQVSNALRAGLMRSTYSLTEAWVLFEMAQREATEVADLRDTLDIDPGQLSRILTRLDTELLITREVSAADARRQVIRLTSRGHAMVDTLGAYSTAELHGLLAALNAADQQRLVGAMDAIREVLEDAPPLGRRWARRRRGSEVTR